MTTHAPGGPGRGIVHPLEGPPAACRRPFPPDHDLLALRGQRVAVLGAARSGVAAANLLRELGARPLLSDVASEEKLAGTLAGLRPGTDVVLGRNELGDAVLVVTSPGIPPAAPILKEVRRRGLPLWSEIELAYRACRAPVVAITGTDGKTTTTTLLGRIVEDAGIPTLVGGNIGRPLSEGILSVPDGGVVVAEVSCFQLLHVERFRPRVGVLLNIAQDHLDYHASFAEYVEAKRRIFRNVGPGDVAVLNGDRSDVAALAAVLPARCVLFSRRERVHGGAYQAGDELVVEGVAGGPHVLLRRSELRLPGDHNVENALAAAAAAVALGVPPARISETLRAFEGLPHRIAMVGWVGGVRYVDDSKATSPHAAIAGLRCFSEPVVLIAGGVDKGLDFGEMAEEVGRRCRAIVLLGQAAGRMAAAFRPRVADVRLAATLEEAVLAARDAARPGDVVLLGPACSSFDMFPSYVHRGEAFAKIVRNLDGFEEMPSP